MSSAVIVVNPVTVVAVDWNFLKSDIPSTSSEPIIGTFCSITFFSGFATVSCIEKKAMLEKVKIDDSNKIDAAMILNTVLRIKSATFKNVTCG